MPSEPCKFQPPKIVFASVKVFEACGTDGKATFKMRSVPVLSGTEAQVILSYERMFEIESGQKCNPAIAVVPDFWAIKPENQRSQLVILYAEVKSTGKLGDGRWSLAIPHYNRPKGFKPKVPDYNKGSWQGILTLKDNSKIIVNAKDRSECSRMINALKINVPVEYRMVNGKAAKAKIGERLNSDLKECRVTAVRADFFSKGQRNMQPDWTIDLRKK
jgi:hypothetical protein